MVRTLEQSTMRKVYLRLLPFAVLSYILAYIDRINVSFAGLTMRGDLEMSAGTFGFAVGMFYLGRLVAAGRGSEKSRRGGGLAATRSPSDHAGTHAVNALAGSNCGQSSAEVRLAEFRPAEVPPADDCRR
jgi:hypothetical protein